MVVFRGRAHGQRAERTSPSMRNFICRVLVLDNLDLLLETGASAAAFLWDSATEASSVVIRPRKIKFIEH